MRQTWEERTLSKQSIRWEGRKDGGGARAGGRERWEPNLPICGEKSGRTFIITSAARRGAARRERGAEKERKGNCILI